MKPRFFFPALGAGCCAVDSFLRPSSYLSARRTDVDACFCHCHTCLSAPAATASAPTQSVEEFKPSPPHADPTSKPPTQPRSAWHRVNCNWWNFSALREVPAAQWRPWFMGLKRNILARSNSPFLMPTIPIRTLSSARSVLLISLSFIYWMPMEMY